MLAVKHEQDKANAQNQLAEFLAGDSTVFLKQYRIHQPARTIHKFITFFFNRTPNISNDEPLAENPQVQIFPRGLSHISTSVFNMRYYK